LPSNHLGPELSNGYDYSCFNICDSTLWPDSIASSFASLQGDTSLADFPDLQAPFVQSEDCFGLPTSGVDDLASGAPGVMHFNDIYDPYPGSQFPLDVPLSTDSIMTTTNTGTSNHSGASSSLHPSPEIHSSNISPQGTFIDNPIPLTNLQIIDYLPQDDFLPLERNHDLSPPSQSPNSSSPTSTSTKTQSNPSRVRKRTLNTLAARRYRQKRVDQVAGLETALKESEAEKDSLKIRVAKLEAEVEVLRGLIAPRG
jgi:hypothetical protein